MPNIDFEVDEFVFACDKYDIKKLIKELVEREYLPKGILNEKGEVRTDWGRKTTNEIDFMKKLDKLKDKYFSLSQEEESTLNEIFDKHL